MLEENYFKLKSMTMSQHPRSEALSLLFVSHPSLVPAERGCGFTNRPAFSSSPREAAPQPASSDLNNTSLGHRLKSRCPCGPALPFVFDFAFLFQGRAGSDGARGMPGQTGPKVAPCIFGVVFIHFWNLQLLFNKQEWRDPGQKEPPLLGGGC